MLKDFKKTLTATSFKITDHKRPLQIKSSLTSLIKTTHTPKNLTFRRSGNLQPIREKIGGHMTNHLKLKNSDFSINTVAPHPTFVQNFNFLFSLKKNKRWKSLSQSRPNWWLSRRHLLETPRMRVVMGPKIQTSSPLLFWPSCWSVGPKPTPQIPAPASLHTILQLSHFFGISKL